MRSLTGGAGNRWRPGSWPSFMMGFFRLSSHSERREDDVSSMPAVPSILRARHAGGRLRQLLVQPLSAVPFFYVFDENKRWISPAMRGRRVIWKKLRSHTNKTITMLCFALTFYIWHKPVHIKTMHFLPLWNPVLAPPTQPSYSVLHVSAPIWTKGMRVWEDFPRWDDSQEASRMFIPSQGSHGFTSERFKRKKCRD